jgi:hypothetical protein
MGKLHRIEDFKRPPRPIHNATFFNRSELNLLLSLYSRRVMSGEWRDYAIDQRAGMAVFSVYRRSQDRPLFTIAKRVGGQGQDSEYLVCRGDEKVLRTQSLAEALTIFRRGLKVVP